MSEPGLVDFQDFVHQILFLKENINAHQKILDEVNPENPGSDKNESTPQTKQQGYLVFGFLADIYNIRELDA